MPVRSKLSEILNGVGAGLGLVAIPSFFVFVAHSLLLGGDALNGGSVDGRYFVASHGNYSEVGTFAYTFNYFAGWICLVTFLAMMGCFGTATLLGSRENRTT